MGHERGKRLGWDCGEFKHSGGQGDEEKEHLLKYTLFNRAIMIFNSLYADLKCFVKFLKP